MTPTEFILQEKLKHPPDTSALNLDWLSGKYTAVEIEKITEEYLKIDYAEYLLQINDYRVPKLIKDLIGNKNLVVGGIHNSYPNAFCKPLGGIDCAVTFNIGLRDFVYRIVRAYSTRYNIAPKEEWNNETALISFEDTCRIISEIYWWFINTDTKSFGPSYPITENQIHFANLIALETEFFFLAHEFGHVIVNYLKSENSSPLESIIYQIEHGSSDEELQADRFGTLICLGQMSSNTMPKSFNPEITYYGIELALVIFSSLEKLGIEVESNNSHPPFSVRIENIRNILHGIIKDDSLYKNLFQFTEQNEILYNKIIDTFLNPSDEQNKYYEKEAEEILNGIKALLENCSNDDVPNYMSFYMGMEKLFNKGYHHKLLDEVFEIGQTFLQSVANNTNGNTFAQADRKIFFQYKLLIGFILRLPEPAKSLFQSKLSL